ncbi:MAG: hypothetical protein GQ524_07580 [Anaerolineales bacterium]|nr:hypothetical protein [Anaerolineales bacterium]
MIKGSVGVLAAGAMFHKPAANTIATKTLAAPTNGSWVIGGLFFGFDKAPALSEEFDIQSPSAAYHLQIPVDTAGVQEITYDPPLRFPMGSAVIIALSADTAGSIGYVAFKSVWVE